MDNLPDDWGMYYHRCGTCGGRYHLSGTEECGCETCDGCDRTYPADELTTIVRPDGSKARWCEDCSAIADRDACPKCGEMIDGDCDCGRGE